MSMLHRIALAALLVLLLPSSGHGQETAEVRVELGEKLVELDRDLAALERLGAYVDSSGDEASTVLEYRLDERTLRLLQRVDDLATEFAALPPGDQMVGDLRQRVLEDFEQVGDDVQKRLEDLDQAIGEQRQARNEQSGQDRLATQVHIDALERQRTRYLEAMTRHVQVRQDLGLPTDDLRARLSERLLVRAERLAGSIELEARGITDLAQRSAAVSDDADIQALLDSTRQRHSRDVARLRATTSMLDELGVRTDQYKAIVVANEGISRQVFDINVLIQLLKQWLNDLRDYLAGNGIDLLINLFLVIVVLLVFRLLARAVRSFVTSALERSRQDVSVLLKNTAVSLASGLVMVFGVLFALSLVGISLGPMLAGLGIAGFIVGFALQDTLGNFASGAMILLYRPYDVDDFVEVPGAAGMVKSMNLVSTTIATLDNQVLVVPNSKIWGDVIKNVTAQRLRRVDLTFGIGYDDDIPEAERVLGETAADHPLVLETPETMVKVHSLGDSSVNLLLRPWVKTEDYWTVYWDLMREVKLRFDREGITIPFPQRTVHLPSKSDAPEEESPG